jgi:uncharacterized protein YyaL (SSP411 family)
MAYTQFLIAMDFMLGPSQEIVVAGDPEDKRTQEMITMIHRAFLPRTVLLLRPDDESAQRIVKSAPFLKEMIAVKGKPAVYVCTQYACQAPITDVETLSQALEGNFSQA